MCGICGYTGKEVPGLVDTMLRNIASRGPDGQGSWSTHDVFLGHTRLAVIDPAHGQQPMTRISDRYTVSYNGEIYNYPELRRELERRGHTFHTNCDTELIPVGFAAWGDDLWSRLEGMFALSLYDRDTGALRLVRDQLGIKPLFYARAGGDLVFSSTVQAVMAHPSISRRLRPQAVREFLQHRWVRSGGSIVEGVETLPAGSFLIKQNSDTSVRRYWQLDGGSGTGSGSLSNWADDVGQTIEHAVKHHLRSDVPMGMFLSGGMDSSVIAHFAARHAQDDLTAFTFSVGGSSDETAQAAAFAREYGFDHREVHMGKQDFDLYPDIIGAMSNPVGEAIIVPTWILCRDTAKEVKVVLSGEGADEVFAGYAYLSTVRMLDKLKWAAPVEKLLSGIVGLVPIDVLNRLFDYEASLGTLGRSAAAELISTLSHSGKLLKRATSIMGDNDLVRGTTLGPAPEPGPADLSLAGLMADMRRDWLPEQILHKTDQLSMAHGLEARVPYVTPRLFEQLARCPDEILFGDKGDKPILRAIAARYELPAAQRTKKAFHLPVEVLWRESLVALCDDWLSPNMNRKHGILRDGYVTERLADLERGEFLAAKQLVSMIGLHAWMEKNGAGL